MKFQIIYLVFAILFLYSRIEVTSQFKLKNKKTGHVLNKDWTIINGQNTNGIQYRLYQIVGTNFCLDSNGDDIYSNPCNPGNDYQNWQFSNYKTYFKLTHKQSGHCLDDRAGDNPDTKYKVYVFSCNGGEYQNWIAY